MSYELQNHIIKYDKHNQENENQNKIIPEEWNA